MARVRELLVPSLVALWAGSCAVFPDEAVLPARVGAGAAGQQGDGEAGAGTVGGEGGSAGLAGTVPVGGAPEPAAGASSGGASGCATQQLVRAATADTWIDSNRPGTGHGNDLQLFVTAGDEQRRALLSFLLPAAPVGATLVRGTVTLHLETNADAALSERHLELSRLEQQVEESRTTWNNWGNGANGRWLLPGGDFGLAVASTTIPALTADGVVTFDVTTELAATSSTTAVPLSLIVLEVGLPPTPPAELAFTSRQGDALGVPELLIEYCP